MVQKETGCCRVLQGVVGCCRVLQGVVGCCRVLQGVAGCCRVLQGLQGSRVLQGVAGCCRLLQDVAGYCRVLQNVTGCCSVSMRCSVLHLVPSTTLFVQKEVLLQASTNSSAANVFDMPIPLFTDPSIRQSLYSRLVPSANTINVPND